jgi:hypothetical protein
MMEALENKRIGMFGFIWTRNYPSDEDVLFFIPAVWWEIVDNPDEDDAVGLLVAI